MRHKTPKQLENVPIIAGFPLKTVVIIIMGSMGFVFTMTVNFLFALVFPIGIGIYVYLTQKYSREGELMNLIKYTFAPKVIVFNKTIEELIHKP